MCGIAGIVLRDGAPVDRRLLARMNETARHRGPDDDGFYFGEGVGLAVRRLAIVDLVTGRQPVHNEDRTAWVVFNGEIYNHRELRRRLEGLGHVFHTRSDTETIIHAYEQYGTACPRYLRGMFAFAIWDERTASLFLARDRVGKKPLLYARVGDQLLWSSEFRALLQHPAVGRDVDYEALDHYLSFMSVPAPLTAYRAIRKLEPAHSLQWRAGRITVERYWDLDFSPKVAIDEDEAATRVVDLLRDAVRARLTSEVPLGAFLSGGVDSSAVVALMAQESSGTVKTFSIGFEEEAFSELPHARRVADYVGTDHHEIIVRPDATAVLPELVEHYGEPFGDSSALPSYYVARETRASVTVALTGDGGDECFAGYPRYAAMKLAEMYRRIPAPARAGIARALNAVPDAAGRFAGVRRAKRFLAAAADSRVGRYLGWITTFDEDTKRALYSDELRRALSSAPPTRMIERWLTGANGLGVVDAVLLADSMTYLPNDLLVKMDIASMSVSLEARSPFLDHHLMEFAAALPESLKLRRLTTKYLLKRALRRLVPTANLRRRKMGFAVPIRQWLRGPMQPFLREIVLSDRALARGLFKPASLRRIVDDHVDARADHEHRLWSLLMLELWFERFID